MNLTHYSDELVTLDRDRKYEQPSPDSFAHKPKGLWLSVDGEDDWAWWCVGEGFMVDSLKHAHRVTLSDKANVLHIATQTQFVEFDNTYSVPEEGRLPASHYYRELRTDAIDWRKVVAGYDGIIIAPYQWDFRLSHMWYYPWDCSSGCIWNLDVIESMMPYDAVLPTCDREADDD